MKRYGNPNVVVTDMCLSKQATLKMMGNQRRQEIGRYRNNRAEHLHIPF